MTLSKRAVKGFPFGGGRTSSSTVKPTSRVALSAGQAMSYEDIYRSQIWVSVVVNKLSRGIARLPLKSYKYGENNSRIRLRPGQGQWLPNLMERPMPGVKGQFSWLEANVGNIGVHGNSVNVKIRPTKGAPPTELWVSPFRRWEMKPGKKRPIDKYIYNAGGGLKLEFDPSEIVHFKWWGPGDDLAGQPPMEPLRATIRNENSAQRLTSASYDNANRPSGLLSSPGAIDDAEAKRLQAIADEMHGGVDRAFKLAVVSGGLDWKPMAHSLVDSALIPSRLLSREEVAAAYDIPPPVIGILDRATFSNVSEQHVMLYQDTMGPWTEMITSTLQEQLIEPELLLKGQYVEFDMNAVLKGNVKETAEAYRLMDHLTPNEKRALDNRERVDDPRADMLWMPLNMMPIGEGAMEMQERLARIAAAKSLE